MGGGVGGGWWGVFREWVGDVWVGWVGGGWVFKLGLCGGGFLLVVWWYSQGHVPTPTKKVSETQQGSGIKGAGFQRVGNEDLKPEKKEFRRGKGPVSVGRKR